MHLPFSRAEYGHDVITDDFLWGEFLDAQQFQHTLQLWERDSVKSAQEVRGQGHQVLLESLQVI